MGALGPEIEEIRFVNTLCKVTQGQQEAAVELARRSQLMIVIGGSNSANTRHLVEICSPLAETYSVETAEEVKSSWLAGKHHIGITAGASTPGEAVEELVDRLRRL
jgi:4-hydroxy-3-methylbut-2-enyl diphosphate reductase